MPLIFHLLFVPEVQQFLALQNLAPRIKTASDSPSLKDLPDNVLRTPPPQPQPTRPHSPIPPWKDITTMVALYVPDLPSKNTASTLAAALFLQLDHTRYHSHHKIYTDGSHSPYIPFTVAAIYDPQKTTCRTWRLPPETDVGCLPSVKLSYIYTSPTPAARRSSIHSRL